MQRILAHSGPLVLRARDVCDASRDATLAVLWSIAMRCQVGGREPVWARGRGEGWVGLGRIVECGGPRYQRSTEAQVRSH